MDANALSSPEPASLISSTGMEKDSSSVNINGSNGNNDSGSDGGFVSGEEEFETLTENPILGDPDKKTPEKPLEGANPVDNDDKASELKGGELAEGVVVENGIGNDVDGGRKKLGGEVEWNYFEGMEENGIGNGGGGGAGKEVDKEVELKSGGESVVEENGIESGGDGAAKEVDKEGELKDADDSVVEGNRTENGGAGAAKEVDKEVELKGAEDSVVEGKRIETDAGGAAKEVEKEVELKEGEDAVVEGVNVDVVGSGVVVVGDFDKIEDSGVNEVETLSVVEGVPLNNDFEKISGDIEEPVVEKDGKEVEKEVELKEDAVVEGVNVDVIGSGVVVVGDLGKIEESGVNEVETLSVVEGVPLENDFEKISGDIEEPAVEKDDVVVSGSEAEVLEAKDDGEGIDSSALGEGKNSGVSGVFQDAVVEKELNVSELDDIVDKSGNIAMTGNEEKLETKMESVAAVEATKIQPDVETAAVGLNVERNEVDGGDNTGVDSGVLSVDHSAESAQADAALAIGHTEADETDVSGELKKLEDDVSDRSLSPEFTKLNTATDVEDRLEAEAEAEDEEGGDENEGSVTDEDTDNMIFGSSEATRKFLEELERGSGAESSHDSSQRIDGQIVTDSDEEVDTDEEGEGDGKELFDSAALAALLKAATGSGADGNTITVSSQDGSRLFSVERPAGLGPSLRTLRPAPRPGNSNLFTPSLTRGGDSDENLSEEEKKKLENLQQLRVRFLRLVHRLGQSPDESIAAQVLYRLAIVAGRRTNQLFNLDDAKKMALQLETEGKDDLEFSLNILVLGKAGVGKSATINSIFAEEKARIHAFEPATSSVKEITGVVDGVRIRVIDSPGLKSSGSEQGSNRKILSSVKKFMKRCPPDIVLYVDRLDIQTKENNDLPLLRTITSVLGAAIWRNAIVTLTHAASAPPDGPSGTPLSYDVFVTQHSHVAQQSIGKAIGDLRLMSPGLMNPVSLVENHPSCRKNREGQKVLPNGQSWRPQLLLLCYSMKILSEASALSKPQEAFDHRKLFGFRTRSPPLPYLLSWLLQSRAHPKLPTDQGGDSVDSDIDLDDVSDSDREEEEDEYDQLPPFKPLRKTQLAKLSKEQKKAYLEEYDYRVKLLQKKQWKEELRRMKEVKKKGKVAAEEYAYLGEDGDPEDGGPAAVPVPLPDMVLPPSFDSDNPAYRYRFLEPTSQFLARPVLDTHGWDHDCGYDGVNVEHSLAIASRFPAAITVQVTKDKKEFNIHLDSSVAGKHGESGSTMAGFDIQNVGKQLAYIVRGETKFKNFKKNKTAAGISVTFLGENIATGLKLEDQIALGKRVTLVGSTGTVRCQSDAAYGANLEVRLKEADFPIGQDQSSLGLSLVKWRGDLALGANLQSQFSVGRSSKIAVRAGLNNKMSGQITVRTSSSDQLQIALVSLLPIAMSIYKLIRPEVSDNYSMY